MVGCFRVKEVVWNYVTTFWHSRLSTLNSEWESPADPFLSNAQMLDPFLRMNWLFFVHSGTMHLADGGDFDPCMHAHTINHTHTHVFRLFPKVGLKFEADHWQVDTSGSHYFIHVASGCSKAGPTAPDTFAAHSALRATGGRFLWLAMFAMVLCLPPEV